MAFQHQSIRITSFRSDGEKSTKLTIEPIQIDGPSKFDLFQIDVNNWRSIPGILFKEIENEPAYGSYAQYSSLSSRSNC